MDDGPRCLAVGPKAPRRPNCGWDCRPGFANVAPERVGLRKACGPTGKLRPRSSLHSHTSPFCIARVA